MGGGRYPVYKLELPITLQKFLRCTSQSVSLERLKACVFLVPCFSKGGDAPAHIKNLLMHQDMGETLHKNPCYNRMYHHIEIASLQCFINIHACFCDEWKNGCTSVVEHQMGSLQGLKSRWLLRPCKYSKGVRTWSVSYPLCSGVEVYASLL